MTAISKPPYYAGRFLLLFILNAWVPRCQAAMLPRCERQRVRYINTLQFVSGLPSLVPSRNPATPRCTCEPLDGFAAPHLLSMTHRGMCSFRKGPDMNFTRGLIRLVPSRLFLVLLVAISSLLALSRLAQASIPTSSGMIYSCFDRHTHIVRVIDSFTTRCTSTERSLTWSQRGPAGPQGLRGAQGKPGKIGAEGP